MQFSRLRLAGFKSFVEPTELVIEPGMTGIVGPNGCGKSNVVEALRWVMGETSAKKMRGGEMDDVIFAGTSDRPARNLAEVILSLDNADRGAPAAFNEADEIDVVRRIERGNGSNYKVNGKDSRARDVQLLFADAASGARSTALVSQGQIGAIIRQKPTERRSMLEEAAGIKGLHGRRHEAELRLKAAETNLERLDDVVTALDEQLRALKRQARQATRYRNLSDHIRKAEAIVLHYRWAEARDARDAAAEQLKAAETAVADLTRLAAEASTAQAEAATKIPGLRQTEAETAAALQRLMVARDALDEEEKRLQATREGIEQRLRQIASDIERENALKADAAEALGRLEGEANAIREAQSGQDGEIETSAEGLSQAKAEVEAFESALSDLMRSVASEESRQGTLDRQIADLEQRRERLVRRLQEVEAEHEIARTAADDGGKLSAAAARTQDAREKLDAARAELEAADGRRETAVGEETVARQAHQTAEAASAKLAAEAEALQELLEIGDRDLWPPMIDAVTVEAGYEIALGAALGDDLTAPTDEAAPVHWKRLPKFESPAPLPAGCRPLSDFVDAPDALARRVSQVGVVTNEALGSALSRQLVQGQRLVTPEGALWRWDGYTVGAGAPTSTAAKLAQRNRLEDMRREVEDASAAVAAARRTLDAAEAASAAATSDVQQTRDAAREADRLFIEARDAEATLAKETEDARSRLQALIESAERLRVDISEVDETLATSRKDREALPDLEERRAEVDRRQNSLSEKRAALADVQTAHDRLVREADMRTHRLQAITADLSSWRQRTDNAERQLTSLAERREAESEELKKIEARPAEIAEQRHALMDRIEAAEGARNTAADALAEAETALEALDRDLKQKESDLAERREDRVRREAAVEQIDQQIATVAERIQERLECAPDAALESVGIGEDDTLPEREAIETKLERLIRERDNMGPVNLRAEAEARELDDRIQVMEAERDDLLAAIAKLRQGIAGLNREGRERLLAAFKEVDTHFQDLFTRLFGGGKAHLALTEADDPLEAGLEIMASPPGKRLQNLTLLSGGEQALTALALQFAVFLTNPAPICVLDEVDAPLDDHNVDRFCTMVEEIAGQTQTRFLLVTHHRLTMARMDRLYGVTMAERGVSQLVSVDLQTAERIRESA